MDKMDIDDPLLLYVARKKNKTRRVWVHDIIQKRDQFGESHTLVRELASFEDKFYSYFRMSQKQFDAILAIIKEDITKEKTNFRDPISAKDRLAMCLSDVASHSPPRHKKSHPPPTKLCEGCQEILDKVKELYSKTWEKHEYNSQKLRLQLSSECNGFDKAIITQANTPVGSKIVYDGETTRTLKVTSKIFSTFAKEHPFQNKTRDTCAVVGNGGILTNSSCGKMIDSAQFVIRCNLPPLENGYEEDVGIKTDLVTANPSIFLFKYQSLLERHRPFVDSLHSYGNSLLLCPAFSYGFNTNVCQRAAYSVEDFEIPMRPVYLNPDYLLSLVRFWRSQGLKENRHSTGLMMVSLALELCTNVHLYGFWPYGNHPQGLYALTNHYYDDVAPKKGVHTMSSEFELLLQLHNQGILRLHLEDCSSD